MTLTICGSATFLKEMEELKDKLGVLGFEVHTPLENGINNLDRSVVVTPKMQGEATKVSYTMISESEGILVANYAKNGVNGYIGGNTLIEMGYALAGNKDIFLLNSIPDVPYRAEIEAMQPIVITGDLSKIQDYYQQLPMVYVSSENILKLKGVSAGFQHLGNHIQTRGKKVDSGVSEEPSSIDEIYQGVITRMKNLKKFIRENGAHYDYLVSVEGGVAHLRENHNVFNVDVCVIELLNGARKVSINSNLEFPKEMTDLVPSVYPDLGVLAQKKYGQKNKDPFFVFTRGNISRFDLLKTAVMNTLSLFS